VFVGAQILGEGINPWSDRTLLEGDRLLGLGWPTGSPHQEKRKQAMGLDGDFLRQFVDSTNRYLLTTKNIAELLEYSFERRKKSQIKFVPMMELPFGTVYKVASENAVMKANEDTEVTKRQRR
jgi:hypothetical protein